MAKSRKKKKNPGPDQVPYDDNGNMRHYPESWNGGLVWKDNDQFFARMKVVGMERGRSAARFIVEDTSTGKRYPLFMKDMLEMIQGQEFLGTWSARKRGQNYGIHRDRMNVVDVLAHAGDEEGTT